MKAKALVAFKTKLYRKLLVLLSLKKPRPQPSHVSEKPLGYALFPAFRKSKERNRVRELRSASEKLISPLPAKSGMKTNHVVEEACRSFENYLVEMIVDEGNVRDVMDVEELLYCWKNLKSPVFVELVSRFYGELCKDLFSPEE